MIEYKKLFVSGLLLACSVGFIWGYVTLGSEVDNTGCGLLEVFTLLCFIGSLIGGIYRYELGQ